MSTHKTVDNTASDQSLPYSDNTLFRNKAANLDHSRAAQPNCPENHFVGLPRCKNLTRFSLFVSFCFAVRYCLKCFCFLCFTSSVSFTGSYTEVKPILSKKQINITHAVLEFCTGRLVTSAPWESTLGNNLNKGMNSIYPFIQIIPQGGLPRGRCDKSSCADFQNSMCDIDLFFQQNGF